MLFCLLPCNYICCLLCCYATIYVQPTFYCSHYDWWLNPRILFIRSYCCCPPFSREGSTSNCYSSSESHSASIGNITSAAFNVLLGIALLSSLSSWSLPEFFLSRTCPAETHQLPFHLLASGSALSSSIILCSALNWMTPLQPQFLHCSAVSPFPPFFWLSFSLPARCLFLLPLWCYCNSVGLVPAVTSYAKVSTSPSNCH